MPTYRLPKRAASLLKTALLAAVCCWSASLPALAAASKDDITREALLRGYTRQDAERRYAETGLMAPGASKPAGTALANAMGTLAANAQRRMEAATALNDRLWFAIENGLDFPMKTQGELDAFKTLLAEYSEGTGKNYNFYARRRQIEFALHLRPHSEHFFPKRDYQEAARLARMNAYAGEDFHPSAALTLAKLHLAGKGVPQDEGEARYLVDLCADAANWRFRFSALDGISCVVMDAQMHRYGWGGPVDPAAAQAALKRARSLLPAALSETLDDETLLTNYR